MEDIWAFWGWEMGLLGKMSVIKGYFGENWAIEVKTGFIRKRVYQKDLIWKLGLLGKIWAVRKNECAKGAAGVKQGFCEKSVCLRDFQQN